MTWFAKIARRELPSDNEASYMACENESPRQSTNEKTQQGREGRVGTAYVKQKAARAMGIIRGQESGREPLQMLPEDSVRKMNALRYGLCSGLPSGAEFERGRDVTRETNRAGKMKSL